MKCRGRLLFMLFYAMSRYMKSTTAQRVQVALGRKLPSAKPVVFCP